MIITTKKQLKICKIILRYKTLEKILKHTRILNYYELQEQFYPGALDFSDYDFEENTIVELGTSLLEEYERQRHEIFYHRWPLIISLFSLVISILALIRS